MAIQKLTGEQAQLLICEAVSDMTYEQLAICVGAIVEATAKVVEGETEMLIEYEDGDDARTN